MRNLSAITHLEVLLGVCRLRIAINGAVKKKKKKKKGGEKPALLEASNQGGWLNGPKASKAS